MTKILSSSKSQHALFGVQGKVDIIPIDPFKLVATPIRV